MAPQATDHHSTRFRPSTPSTSRGAFPARRATSSVVRWSSLRVLLPALMLWLEAFLVRSSADTPGIIAPTAAIAGSVGLFLVLPILSKPWLFRLLIGALALLLLVRLVKFPPEATESGFIVVPRIYTVVLAELLLCCQALLLWRWRSRDPLPITFCCLALVTSVLALNRTLPLGTQTIHVGLAVASLLLPTMLVASQSQSSRTRRHALTWSVRFVLVLVCGSVLLGTWAATEAWSRWLPDVQAWLGSNVQNIASNRVRLRQYATLGSLSAIRMENSNNPNGTALRVFCNDRPGYLAGRVFDQYQAGNWSIASDAGRRHPRREWTGRRILKRLDSVPEGISSSSDPHSVFEINSFGSSDALRRMSIENDPRRGNVVFTPLGCRYLLGSGNSIVVDDHDIVRSGLSVYSRYVAIVDKTSPVRPLSNQLRRQLRAPLPGLDPRIAALSNQICRRARTPRGKIRAIRDYFRDNFEYSLARRDVPSRADPLNHFLLNQHPAHCEFFASGAVALLRLQGIPARYATGYCVMERDKEHGNHWIARNRDAHAWAEAYDEQQRRWVIVEATPGFTDPTLEDSSAADENADGAQGSGLAFAAENASAIAQWWRDLPPRIKSSLLAMLAATLGLILFVAMRRTHGAQASRAGDSADPRIRKWQRLLRRMDRRLKHRGLVRHRSETLHQFAQRIRSLAGGQDRWMQSSADWYRDYAATRFRAAGESPPRLPSRR